MEHKILNSQVICPKCKNNIRGRWNDEFAVDFGRT